MIFENRLANLSKNDEALLDSYFDGFEYESSAHTFLANYIWRNTRNITWQIIEDYLVFAALDDTNPEVDTYFMSMPLTKDGTYDIEKLRKTLEKAKAIFNEKSCELKMKYIPKACVPFLEEATGLVCEHVRDDDDYIYLRSDLETLSGRKLHQKKNHLNFFKANYEYVYEEITEANVKEVIDFVEGKNDYLMQDMPEGWQESLALESVGVEELLSFVPGRTFGGLIRVGGKIKAVTLAEYARTTSKETVVVHIEKADDRIRGLYQAINNEFVKHLPEETIFVNREEDMGLLNLRKTKEGYKPVKMGEKFFLVIK